MNIDRDVVSNILQEKGFLRFKPFNLNNDTELYAYYTEEYGENVFHFCDNKLHDLTRKDIGLQDGALFILGTKESYSLMEEYTHVKGHNGQVMEDGYDDGWLIDEDNVILHFFINGYFKISKYHYVLESSFIDATKDSVLSIWSHNTAKKSYTVYDTRRDNIYEDHRSVCSYYGSINSYHILYDSDNRFFLINEKGDIIDTHLSDIWLAKDTIKLIKVEFGEDSKIVIRNIEHKNEIKVRVPVKLDNSCGTYFSFYAKDETLCCIYHHYGDYFNDYDKQLSSHIFIITKNTMLYEGAFKNNDDIFDIKNGILVVKRTEYASYKKDLQCSREVWTHIHSVHYFDFQLVELGEAYSPKKQFVVVKRPYYKIGCNIVSKDFLYGILDTYDMKLFIPIRYDSIEILHYDDPFYVRVGMLKSDGQSFEYGLFFDNKLLLPINNEDITLLNYHGKNLIRWKRDNKYGLICNDEIRLNNVYQSIDIKDDHIMIGNNDKVGFYIPSKKYLSPIQFNTISCIHNNIVISDNNMFRITDNDIEQLTAFKDDYVYVDSLYNCFMFRKRDISTGTRIGDYICYCSYDDGIEKASVDYLDEYDIEELRGCEIRNRTYFLVDESLYYDVEDGRFVFKEDIIEEESYSSYTDDYDYDRDTFYALGGDDYDDWRNNGGNLDDMMDGMGY